MIDMTPITVRELAALIDHTFLKPSGGSDLIEKLCREARSHGFAMVAVNPAEVSRCGHLLKGSPVRVGAAVGFPLGQNTVRVKAFEIEDAIRRGATEIDMVINQRAIHRGDYELVNREIEMLASICKPRRVISKVILECCHLTDAQKIAICRQAVTSGCNYVKTSTGFSAGGATVKDVKLMRETVGNSIGVKAAGGIRNLGQLAAMLEAGASRIGTSSGVTIMKEFMARQDQGDHFRGDKNGRS